MAEFSLIECKYKYGVNLGFEIRVTRLSGVLINLRLRSYDDAYLTPTAYCHCTIKLAIHKGVPETLLSSIVNDFPGS